MELFMLYPFLRKLLFLLPPEFGHNLVLRYLTLTEKLRPQYKCQKLSSDTPVFGLHFPNKIGLAAGLDKNGDCIDGLSKLGFGFIEIGTVTPRAQSGNPKPRLFRLPKAQAIINRMGFNNKGVDYLIQQVKKKKYQGILGINIGKNFDTALENAINDYVICMRKVYVHANYITINISSPNTPGLRDLQHEHELRKLLFQLKQEQSNLQQQYQKYVPLLIKIAPDLNPSDVQMMAQIILEQKIDGVIATNTTISRDCISAQRHSQEKGGLSGKPLFERSLAIVTELQQCLQGAIPIIACGGIMSNNEAKQMFNAGASLIQIYTGFIYRGPELIRELCKFSTSSSAMP